MEFEFLIGGILTLILAVFILRFSFCKCKEKVLRKPAFLFSILAISFLIESLFFLLAFFKIIDFCMGDFYLIRAVLLLIRVSIFVLLFGIMLGNKHLKYFLIFYFLVFFSFFLSGIFYALFFFISYLILFLIFLLLFNVKNYAKLALTGWIYAIFSLISFFLLFIEIIPLFVFESLSFIFLIWFLSNLFKGIKLNRHLISVKKRFLKESNFIIDFLKYFLFIVLLTNFIFVSTVTIHELGHFGTSKFLDCSYSKIVYDGALPHTEILCQNQDSVSQVIAILGGVIFPFFIAFIFFFVGGKFMKEIGLLLIGFGLTISYMDFLSLGLSEAVSLFFSLLGILIIIFSIGLLVSSRVEEKEFLYFVEGNVRSNKSATNKKLAFLKRRTKFKLAKK